MERGPDFGPIYTETNLDRFPVEPLNALSNFVFLWVIIHWLKRKRQVTNPQFRSFLNISLPILFVGFVGGTVYHATRWHWIWLTLDFVPILILSLFTSFYHWRLVGWPLWKSSLAVLILLFGPFTLIRLILGDMHRVPSMGYAVLSLTIVFPLVFDQYKLGFPHLKEFLRPILLIIVAIFFRSVDNSLWVVENFPWGTHWLWHSLGAITCHLLLVFMEKRAQYQQ